LKGGIRRERLPFYLAEYVWQYNNRKLTVEKQIERLLKLPRPYGRGINQFTSAELKSAEAENRSASLGLTPGEFREGGLNLVAKI